MISINKIEHRESNTYSQITKHFFLFLLLIKHSSTMDSSSDDSSDSSSNAAIEWSYDEFDVMAVAVLVVVNNNNIAITNLIAKANHEQMINDVIAPNQHYRNKPRRPNMKLFTTAF